MTASRSGSLVAAPISPPTSPHRNPSRNAFPAETSISVASELPPTIAKISIHSANGMATTSAHPSRASGGAPSVRCSCERVVQISAPSGIASSISGWIRRAALPMSGLLSRASIGVSTVPTACRNASVTKFASTPTSPTSEMSGEISPISKPAASTIPAEIDPAISAATIPGSARRSRISPESSPACGSTRPIRSCTRGGRGGGCGVAAAGWEYSGGRGGGSGATTGGGGAMAAGGGGIGSAGTCSAGVS